MKSMKADLVQQYPTNPTYPTKDQEEPEMPSRSRDPYRQAAPRPPSYVDPIAAIDLRAPPATGDGLTWNGTAWQMKPTDETQKRISMLDIDDNWPASISRDEPEKLSAETRAHTFFVRTQRPELLANIDVLGFIAKCPDVGDGHGVRVHRDVIQSLGYHLLDKVHELETLRKGQSDLVKGAYAEGLHRDGEPRYDERLSKALDQLGDKDAELKELRAALGEAAVKIRRLETKLFK